MKKIDLHTHTYFSDGYYSPLEIINLAHKNDINVISITDHDTVDAYLQTDLIQYAKNLGIEVIPGIEISTELNDTELHILGYFIDIKNESLSNLLQFISKERINRAKRIIKKIQNRGYDITFEEVLENNKSTTIGRPHIANVMIKKGFVKDLNEAFNKHLGINCYAYEKKIHITPKLAIEFIHNAGGIAVLAHPNKTNEDIIKYLIEVHIDGFEIIHPSHSNSTVNYYKNLADYYYLVSTGGSDFHGGNKKDDANFGNFYISQNKFENILEYQHKL